MAKTKRKPAWQKPKVLTPEAQAARDEQSRVAREAHLARVASAEFDEALLEATDKAIDAISEKLRDAAVAQWEAAEKCAPDSIERAQHHAAHRALQWARDVMIHDDLDEAPHWRPDQVGQPYIPSDAWRFVLTFEADENEEEDVGALTTPQAKRLARNLAAIRRRGRGPTAADNPQESPVTLDEG
jgi:hypothetical protein